MKIIVLVISDTCAVLPAKDTAGPAARDHIISCIPTAQVTIIHIPDDPKAIEKELTEAADVVKVASVITSGGTGFGQRDFTPEVTSKLIHKPAPHLATALALHGLPKTPLAVLSRSVAGIRNKTLIVNLPGSRAAVDQCFELLKDILPHAISLILNETNTVKDVHSKLQHAHEHCHSKNATNLHTRHKHACTHAKDSHAPASRPRQSAYRLLEVEEALHIIEEQLGDWFKQGLTEQVAFNKALGRVSAEDVFSVDPLPPFAASIKDGYACLASDGTGIRRVALAVTAGDAPERKPLQKGECARINTGAPIPPGADCVVQVEDTKLVKTTEDKREELEIEILVAPRVGQDVRPPGSDIRTGQIVLAQGDRIDAARIGALAGAGRTNLKVRSRPKISLLSTGSELQTAESGALKEGCVRDSNGPMLRALLVERGWDCVDVDLVADKREALAQSMLKAFAKSDILICSGGVSMGERDLIKPILENELNATVHFGRTRMKPGKPTTFATCNVEGRKKYIFALPGNPASAYVTFLLFVYGGLRASEGLNVKWPSLKVRVPTPLPVLDPRPEYARASMVLTPVPTVTLFDTQCSSCILSGCGSACLVLLPGKDDKPTLDTSKPFVELDALITHQENISIV